jgi:carbonic anhydrase/acetyltransferase-like protein (isoleucine patch superfamily)
MAHKDVYVHPTAEVSPKATIGEGTKIWNNVQVREGAVIGKNCVISKGVYIDVGVNIGDRVKIQNGVSIYKGVTLEDEVFVGPHSTFTNDIRPRAFSQNWDVIPTRLRRGSSVGANATIVCGITLGVLRNGALHMTRRLLRREPLALMIWHLPLLIFVAAFFVLEFAYPRFADADHEIYFN